MAKLARKLQKIFGETGGATEFGKIGSDALGTPATSKDLDEIQSLSPFEGGLFDITANAAEPPKIEDINSLYLLITTQLKYLFQNGIPEWIATEDYYADVSYVQVAGVLYRCVADSTGDDPTTDDGTYWEPGDASIRQLAFDADRLGLPFVATDLYAKSKQEIAFGKSVGELVYLEHDEAPVAYADAQSSANPSNPEYFPAIPRHDNDHDVSTAEAPLLVAKLKDLKLDVLGTTDFPISSVSGSRITFSSTTAVDKMLSAVQAAALVNRWFSSGQSATFAASGGDYTMAGRQYAINVNGTLYPITDLSVGSRYIDVTGSPASVATAAIMPYAISGESTKIRLRRLSGFVPVAGGELDGEVIISLAKMDRGQGHRHGFAPANYYTQGGGAIGAASWPANAPQTPTLGSGEILDPATDGTNGTPRTGKTTDPRGYGVAVYTWARTLLATTWTNP